MEKHDSSDSSSATSYDSSASSSSSSYPDINSMGLVMIFMIVMIVVVLVYFFAEYGIGENRFKTYFTFETAATPKGLLNFHDEKAWHFDKKMLSMSYIINFGLPKLIEMWLEDVEPFEESELHGGES